MPGTRRPGVFISYRRDDTGPYARSLQRDLSQRIPDARIFMDLDSIEAGMDFAQVIEEAVNSSAVLVALIGRQWATITDEDGARRLDNPDDYVRFEVTTALERGVRVIPVLVDGARALGRRELPAELHKLARLNAAKLSYDRYQEDADRLLDLIQQVIGAVSQKEEPGRQTREEAKRQAGPRILFHSEKAIRRGLILGADKGCHLTVTTAEIKFVDPEHNNRSFTIAAYRMKGASVRWNGGTQEVIIKLADGSKYGIGFDASEGRGARNAIRELITLVAYN